MAWWLQQVKDMPFAVIVIVPTVAVTLLAYVVEKTLVRWARGGEAIFLITIGLTLILQQVAVIWWGADARQIRPPVSGSWAIGDVYIPKLSAYVFITAA